jgi:hypothetical protein
LWSFKMNAGMTPSVRICALLAALGLSAMLGVPAQAEPDEVLVAVAGDIACDPDAPVADGQCRDAATAELILSRGPALVLALGDTQYVNGSLKDFLRAYDLTWGKFKGITYPTVGNHEYLSGSARGYQEYFGTRAGGEKAYYAFDVNGWRLYSLNAECDRINCDEERDWMRADVRANRRTCQLMFMHRPLYSSGGHKSAFGRRFWVVGYNNRFELALAGHEHRYERFAPMNPFGTVVSDGIRSFTVGTGGKSLFRAGIPATGSEFRYNQNYGVQFLKLRPGSYDWEFWSIAGELIDSGSGTCS